MLTGSFGSGGGGLRDVLTEQKRHARVHVSPSTYNKPNQHLTCTGHCWAVKKTIHKNDTLLNGNAEMGYRQDQEKDHIMNKDIWREANIKPINQSINQSINRSIDRSIDRSINKSINPLYSGIFHPYTNYVIIQLCDKKTKQTSMHVYDNDNVPQKETTEMVWPRAKEGRGRDNTMMLRHSTLGRSSVSGPAHKFPGFGATVFNFLGKLPQTMTILWLSHENPKVYLYIFVLWCFYIFI